MEAQQHLPQFQVPNIHMQFYQIVNPYDFFYEYKAF